MTDRQIVLAIFITFFLVVIGKSVWSKIQLRRKSRSSLGWPLAKATILRDSVTPKNKGEFGVAYSLEVRFTYLATGLPGVAQSEHQGAYREEFSSRHEAERMMDSLKTGPLLVRFNPLDPTDHFMDPYRAVREPSKS